MNRRAMWSTRLFHCVIAIAIACTGVVAHAQSASFALQNPHPSPAPLFDLQYSGGVLFGVGQQNTLVKSTDGGQTWINQLGDANALTDLRDVFATSDTRAWAGGGWQRVRGADTTILGDVMFTNDGGNTWARQILTFSTMINGIYFSSATQGWAVGRGKEALTPYTWQKSFVYFTNDGGNSWTRQTNGVPATLGWELKSVVFANNSTGYAIGGAIGQGAGYDNDTPEGTWPMYTTNSGTNWTQSSFPNGSSIAQICPVSLTRAFAVGNIFGTAALLYTTDNGASWSNVTNGFPTTFNGHLTSIVFPSATTGYAIGWKNVLGQMNLLVLKTVDAGNTWNEVDPSVSLTKMNARPNRVTAADASNLWIGGKGSGAWVASTANGGGSWTTRSVNVAASGYADPSLTAVSFADQVVGWSVGSRNNPGVGTMPSISYTDDGGATWTSQSPSGVLGTLSGVAAISPTEAWAGGWNNLSQGTLFHTIDGGMTWTSWLATQLGISGQVWDIAFASPANGYGVVTTSAGLYYTRNGGASWNLASGYGSAPIRFGSYFKSTVVAVSDAQWYKSVDSGKTWTVQSANVMGSGTIHLDAISMIPSGIFGWASGWAFTGAPVSGPPKGGHASTQSSIPVNGPVPVVSYTTNGGATWTQQAPYLRNGYFLITNPRWPCQTCSQFLIDSNYSFNEVNNIIALAPFAAVGTTKLNYSALSSTGTNWNSTTGGGNGSRVVLTTDAGATWYEVDSTFQSTLYGRLSGTLTNRLDISGVGVQGMIRHGFFNVPLISSSPDTLFRKKVLSVNPTDSAYDSITVRNTGTATLVLGAPVITSIDPTNPQLDYTVLSSPSFLTPGQSGIIYLKFKPSLLTQRYATMTFTTNSIVDPVITVGLRGSGGLAIVQYNPKHLFDKVVPVDGGFEDGTITICNPGVNGVHADLHVGVPTLIDSTLTNSYSIISAPAGVVAPGQCVQYVVRFQPTVGGVKRGSITIPTNARDYPSITVTLGGVGGVRSISQDTSFFTFVDTIGCDSSTQCLLIHNRGTLGDSIMSIAIDTASMSEFTISSNTVGNTLAAGGSGVICIKHKPTVFGLTTGFLIIKSNAINKPVDTITLAGVGKAAIVVFGTHLVLKSDVPAGQTYDTAISMRNIGNIRAQVVPQFSTVNQPWQAILPFRQFPMAGEDTVFKIRYNAQQIFTNRTDTLMLVLQWSDSAKCSAIHIDTITYIYSVFASAVRENLVATKFDLLQNFPNPFNPTTYIEYMIPSRVHVTLRVYNALGQMVVELENGMMEAGTYRSTFDASRLPSGNYSYELSAGSYTKRMIMSLTK